MKTTHKTDFRKDKDLSKKIYAHESTSKTNKPKMARLQCGNLDIAAILNWVCNVDSEHQ